MAITSSKVHQSSEGDKPDHSAIARSSTRRGLPRRQMARVRAVHRCEVHVEKGL